MFFMGHGVSIFIFTAVLLSCDLNFTYNEIHINALYFLLFFPLFDLVLFFMLYLYSYFLCNCLYVVNSTRK